LKIFQELINILIALKSLLTLSDMDFISAAFSRLKCSRKLLGIAQPNKNMDYVTVLLTATPAISSAFLYDTSPASSKDLWPAPKFQSCRNNGWCVRE
jgi:hypothetical protein